LPKIEHLFLNGNELSEWKICDKMPFLKELRVDFNQIRELKIENSINSLEILSLKYFLGNSYQNRNNLLENIDNICELQNLKELYLDHNGISEISKINLLSKITVLSISNNKISEYFCQNLIP